MWTIFAIENTVIFGSEGLPELNELRTADIEPDQGFVFESDAWFFSVNSAGDVNGDGINDIFATENADRFGREEGMSVLVWGGKEISRDGRVSLDDAAMHADHGMRLPMLATAAGPVGDINGDGFADLGV